MRFLFRLWIGLSVIWLIVVGGVCWALGASGPSDLQSSAWLMFAVFGLGPVILIGAILGAIAWALG